MFSSCDLCAFLEWVNMAVCIGRSVQMVKETRGSVLLPLFTSINSHSWKIPEVLSALFCWFYLCLHLTPSNHLSALLSYLSLSTFLQGLLLIQPTCYINTSYVIICYLPIRSKDISGYSDILPSTIEYAGTVVLKLAFRINGPLRQ